MVDRIAHFTLNEIDFQRAMRLHVFSSYREAKTLIKLLILWTVCVLALGLVLYWLGEPLAEIYHGLPQAAFWMAIVAFGTPLAIPLIFGPFAIRRRLRQDKLVLKPVSAGWDDTAYEVEQPEIRNQITWSDYYKLREDQHSFLFFVSDYSYQILPKRALSREQIEDLQRIISAI